MKHESCAGCKNDLGGGCCKVSLELECAAGGFEMYEQGGKHSQTLEEHTGEVEEYLLEVEQIEGFIAQFKGAEEVFTRGMCYWFAFILQSRFERGEIIYDPVVGHFMLAYRGRAYDVEGGHMMPQVYETWRSIRMTDPRRYLRIVRDCVMKAM